MARRNSHGSKPHKFRNKLLLNQWLKPLRNYDQSLIEVWEWKEKVYQDIKNLTTKEYVEKVKNDADKLLSENSIELTPIFSETRQLVK